MDLSEQCGYTIHQQVDLFNSIKPLMKNKPLIICLNKVDVKRRADLSQEQQDLLKQFESEDIPIYEMSTLTEEGVAAVKSEACDKILSLKTESKVQGRKLNNCINRLHVSMPAKRDSKARPPCIPEAALKKRMAVDGGEKRKLEKDLMLELGDDYFLDLQKHYDLAKPEEKYDVIPELWRGHNIADYVDPQIMKKLMDLEREEELREKAGLYDSDESDDDETKAKLAIGKQIRERQKLKILESREKRRVEKPRMPRTGKKITETAMKKTMATVGLDVDMDKESHFGRSRSKSVSRVETRKRKRDESTSSVAASRSRSASRTRPPRDKSGVRDETMAKKARKMHKISQREMNQNAKKGEADRRHLTSRPKHLYSGKRKMGKTDRR
jgi:nucleolar GTP-binding protein